MAFLEENRRNYAWNNAAGDAGFNSYISDDEFFNVAAANTGVAAPPTLPAANYAAPQGGLADCSTYNNDCNCYYGGCTEPTAQNYDPAATCDDGSCTAGVFGCTDPLKLNYSNTATYNDGSCGPTASSGCTDPAAANYNSNANTGCNWQGGPAVPSPTAPINPQQSSFSGYANAAGRGRMMGDTGAEKRCPDGQIGTPPNCQSIIPRDTTAMRVAGPRGGGGPVRGDGGGPVGQMWHICSWIGCQEGYECTSSGCEPTFLGGRDY